MPALTAPYLAAAALLALAALGKLRWPAGTRQALRTQGWPSSMLAVRLLGLVELAVAVAALGGSRPGAAALAVAYAGFTGFVGLALLRRRPLTSCGCFSGPDLPPTRAHPVVTAVFAGVAATVAVGHPAGLTELWAAGAWPLAAAAAGAVLIGWLSWVVLVRLPDLVAAAAGPAPGSVPRPFSIPTSVR